LTYRGYIMPEFSTLSDIFGRSTGFAIKKMDGVEGFNVNADDRSCFMTIGGQEYKVRRANQRKWYVTDNKYWWFFWSQEDLLAWICDQL